MKENVIKILIVILFTVSTALLCSRVADYDIKAAHYAMDTNYCPYCGEKLDGGGN